MEKLIVRRGQVFTFEIELDRTFKPGTDEVEIFLMYGPKPRISKGTLIKLSPSKKEISSNKYWTMRFDKASRGNKLKVEMMPSVATMVSVVMC